MRLHDAAHAPKEIKHRNTRFTGQVLLESTFPQTQVNDTRITNSLLLNKKKNQQELENPFSTMVAMTPSPMPASNQYNQCEDNLDKAITEEGTGGEGDNQGQFSPIMTWGEIEGTPLILDPSMTPGKTPILQIHLFLFIFLVLI